MSNKRYLEIDSTYRNREQFPNPSNFTVLIAQSGTRDAAHAYDPVSNAAPLKLWSPDKLELAGGVVSTNPLNTEIEFTVCFPVASNANRNPNYYTGYPISIVSPGSEIVQIVNWSYVSSSSTLDCFIITVTPSFSGVPAGLVTFETSVNNYANGTIFVPDGFLADHFYFNWILYNETTVSYRPIISYDGTSKIIGLNLSNEFGGPINTTWSDTDILSIRKSPPKSVDTLLDPALPPYPAGQPVNTSLSFSLPSSVSINIGDFIRLTSGGNTNVSCRVVKYTYEGVKSKTSPGTYTTYPYIVTTNCILDVIPVAGDTFEILQFTRDNAVPFCYSGSLVSQQEMVCYQIELLNLVLPNKTLISGGRTAFYPYVYVELQNVSSSSAGTKNIIYSNNPNAQKMLFRAAIDDIPNPVISPFIKIDGDGMVQTVKFKPNDNFKFGVYLPNGDPLETVESDAFSPSSSNPLVQISAVFSIKRL